MDNQAPNKHQREATSSVSQQLISTLKDFGALPYLFIGSGVSRRYLDLPDWHGLLKYFADEAGINYDKVRATSNDDLPTIASKIAREYNDFWWETNQYDHLKEERKGQFTSFDSALKLSISNYIRSNDSLNQGKPGFDNDHLRDEVESLRHIVIDGVITTNYDSFIEGIFPDLEPFVGQSALLFGNAQFISEIYKIHGSATDAPSMLLTSEDYSDFSSKNKYLAAKLLTIFAEHPVIFVGYSLNDEYLAQILDDIARAVGPRRVDELGRRIIFVEWNCDPHFIPRIESSSIVRGDHQEIRLPITRIETNSFKWIWDSLQTLNRPFPPKLLRKLREHVYNLVVNPDPAQPMESVRALPMDSEAADDVNVVFGVARLTKEDRAALSGITARAFTIQDIIDDFLGKRSLPLHASNILDVVIPEIIRPNARSYVPVYKYLQEEGLINNERSVDFTSLKPAIERIAKKPLSVSSSNKSRFEKNFEGKNLAPSEIVALGLSFAFTIDTLCLLDLNGADTADLKKSLIELERFASSSQSNFSLFKKLLCHYDRLTYLGQSDISVS